MFAIGILICCLIGTCIGDKPVTQCQPILCALYCQDGNEVDKNGCSICSCIDACTQKIDSGKCDNNLLRWGYNKQTGLCESFSYGGCEGNKNNFLTLGACADRCVDCPKFKCQACSQGNSRDERGCKGCGCNDICELPVKVVPCGASEPRFYHNNYTRQCESFSLGECNKNENNFKSIDDCFEACEPCPVPGCINLCELGYKIDSNGCKTCTCLSSDDICSMPQDVGPCQTAEKRYWFDSQTGKCDSFFYGGCYGNANNFATSSACNSVCKKKN